MRERNQQMQSAQSVYSPSGLGDAHMADRIATSLTGRVDYREEVKRMAQNYPYVVLYGCGDVFHSVMGIWTEVTGRPIDFCCDSNPDKWGHHFAGVRCLSLDELLKIRDRCAVFVTIGQFRPVLDFLTAAGFPSVNVLYRYDLVSSDFLDTHDAAEITANLLHARQLFADRESLRVFDSILERVFGGGRDPDLMVNICEGDQYFPADIVRLSDHECFVDVGAFDGDTVRDFVTRTGSRFDRIDAFELNNVTYSKLTASVARMPTADRINLFNLGIWDADCDVTYTTGQFKDTTIGSGETMGHVVPLDNVLSGERVTYIKMDIEGAEPNGLRGAKTIIQTQKPRLAVCVYHHLKHLWEIPTYINALVPEYKLYLRHHTSLEYETVCYAVL